MLGDAGVMIAVVEALDKLINNFEGREALVRAGEGLLQQTSVQAVVRQSAVAGHGGCQLHAARRCEGHP